jgi:hypothetical protein
MSCIHPGQSVRHDSRHAQVGLAARGDGLAGARARPTAVLDLAEELAVDLAEALDTMAAVERRDAVEVADRWFHDQPEPDLPGPPGPGGPDIG